MNRISSWDTAGPKVTGLILSNSVTREDATPGQTSLFLLQGEGVNIAASNVAEHQRRVCGIQRRPHTPGHLPILQIDNLLYLAPLGARIR